MASLRCWKMCSESAARCALCITEFIVCAISAAQQLVYFWCGEKEREGGCVMLYFTFTDKNAHIIFGGVFKMPGRLADWFWLCLVLVWWCMCSAFIYILMPLHAGYMVNLKINTRRHFRIELCIPHQSVMEKTSTKDVVKL